MNKERQIQYDKVYMRMAKTLSELSYAERNKVGCIIVSPKGQIISQGYNGTPTGYDNCCEYTDENGNLITKKEVLHAESNAISKCAKWLSSTEDATLYVTLSPCFECAKVIIQAGIKRVCYNELYRNTEGLEFLKKNGIQIDQIFI
jgi:dCMP deaminase